MRVSTPELLIVLLIVIVIFGPKQLPRLGQMLGSSVKSFKKGLEEETPAEPAAPAAPLHVEAPAAEKDEEN